MIVVLWLHLTGAIVTPAVAKVALYWCHLLGFLHSHSAHITMLVVTSSDFMCVMFISCCQSIIVLGVCGVEVHVGVARPCSCSTHHSVEPVLIKHDLRLSFKLHLTILEVKLMTIQPNIKPVFCVFRVRT